MVLEILIEELHNHLYLKSFYTDVRWRSYTRGQTSRKCLASPAPRLLRDDMSHSTRSSLSSVPVVDFGDDATDNYSSLSSYDNDSPQAFLPGRSTARLPRMSKLQRFLQNLALKPAGAAADPAVDETLEELLVEPAAGEGGGGGVDSINAANEDDTIADGLDGFGGGGGGKDKDTDGDGGAQQQQQRQQQGRSRPNPEVDSFAYIEMLLEALAALGKLGYALDAVGQRIQGELFALVEATIEEVEERQVCVSVPLFLLFFVFRSLSLPFPCGVLLFLSGLWAAGSPVGQISDLSFHCVRASTGTIPIGLLPTR